jgi:membrane associated rhomboid family serine protease
MLPFYDDNPVRSRPILTWAIIAACIAAFFLWQPGPFEDNAEDTLFYLENAAIPCELVEGRPLDAAELQATYGAGDTEACDVDQGASPQEFPDKNVWLSALTSMFLHGSLLHIGGNLLFLWVFGNNVEDVFGKIGFALFYAVGGVVATLAHVALNVDSTVPVVGASGAIAAVMGAYLVLFPQAKVRTAIIFLLVVVVNIRAFWVLGFWFVLQFFTNPDEGVAWAAHVGGFVFGVLVALVVRMFRQPQVPSPSWSYPRYGGYGRY